MVPVKNAFKPLGGLGCCPFEGGGYVVVDLLFGVLPIGCGGSVFVFVLLCITLCPFFLKWKRELVALLLLSYGCLDTVLIL